MSDQQATFRSVLNRLSTLRSSLSAEEQSILDQMVTRTTMDMDVSAHSIIKQAATSTTWQVSFNIATGQYERIDL